MENGLEKNDENSSMTSESNEMGSKSPQDPFLGFSPAAEVSKKATPKEPVLRVSQPRTSKSRASLVWQKAGRQTEVTIKEEPEDGASPRKSTKHVSSNEETAPYPVKIESNDDDLGRGKRSKKQKHAENSVETSKEESMNGTSSNPTTGVNDRKKSKNIPSTSSNHVSGVTALNQTNIIRKRRQNRKKTAFKCDQCGRNYKYLRGMRQHQRLECNVEPQFPCPYCPSRYRYRQGIREHVRNYHEQAFPKWYATHYVIPMLQKESASDVP